MKKFTLLFVLICAGAVTFGQVLRTADYAPVKLDGSENQNLSPKVEKGGGDVIWQTTFNWADPTNPRGWSLPEGWTIKDVSDMGNPWIWLNDTLIWYVGTSKRTLNPPSFFPTKSDGYLALPIQSYNQRDGITTTVPADSWFETPQIDCSKVSSVVVKFTQVFNLCCLSENVGNLQMLVTVDEGVHWATYDVQYNWGANNATPTRFQTPEVNISDVAAGSPNVRIRFYFHNGNQWYYWMIDDLKLVEAYNNNLVLEDTWLDFDGGFGATIDQVHYWPLSQMGMAGDPTGTVGANYFKAAVLNSGNYDSENVKLDLKVLKNGTEVFADASPAATIFTLDRDTAIVVNPYLATDYGDYKFLYNIVSDNTEEVPGNNSTSMQFTVNDTLGHRADFTAEAGVNTGGWVGGNNSGDMMAVAYDLYAPAEINSITAYIYGWTPSQTPQFQFVLVKDVDGTYEEWITSDVIDMDSTMPRTWVTLPMTKDGETEFLQPGNYSACVRMMGVDPNRPTGVVGMSVGRDLSTKYAGCAQFYATSGWTGLAGGPLAMIGFNVNASGGPTQAPVTFNVDMNKHIASGEFKPGTDYVDVAGNFDNWAGSAHMTDPEADGIYTITLDNFVVNSKLQYKYRLNGVIEAYPLTGNPYRSYTIRYWNVLNDTFNGGIASDVEQSSLVASFSIYPNPTSGSFTVAVTNTVPSDLVISLTNIQGQVVYQNKVKNVVNHQESIDNNLSKGVYFLSVNNGKEVKVQKVVVQ
ncbi:MAG: T9SS type A sorting domain-containing protein [Bacteroidales bacterium]|jgi:hypothetical protein